MNSQVTPPKSHRTERAKPQEPTIQEFLELFEAIAAGRLDSAAALERARQLAGDADGARSTLNLDFDRERRCGVPEVIYGEGKRTKEIRDGAARLLARHGRVLVTRIAKDVAGDLLANFNRGEDDGVAMYHERARCLVCDRDRHRARVGRVLVLAAGTSDAAVADEARVTADFAGCQTRAHYDVGVAGLHRLLAVRDEIATATSIIVVAGMDGALPSVVAGLCARPVIAVPTSIGYGAALGGISALLTMLNSCAAGLAVVNIDNGFGAGMLAARIEHAITSEPDTVEGGE